MKCFADAVAPALALALAPARAGTGTGTEIAVDLVVDLAVCSRSVLTVAADPAFHLISPSAVLKDE